MGRKLPTLPRPYEPPEIPRKCAEQCCTKITIKQSPWFPYCSFDCKDWAEQMERKGGIDHEHAQK